MINTTQAGLGELLRHLIDLLDLGSEEAYQAMDISYRARYTPIMRAFKENSLLSVSEIRSKAHLTQGAISQTVKLMEVDGLIERVETGDGRSRSVQLTKTGASLHQVLLHHWQQRLDVIANLETEIGYPLRSILATAIQTLEDDGFSDRLSRLSKEGR